MSSQGNEMIGVHGFISYLCLNLFVCVNVRFHSELASQHLRLKGGSSPQARMQALAMHTRILGPQKTSGTNGSGNSPLKRHILAMDVTVSQYCCKMSK